MKTKIEVTHTPTPWFIYDDGIDVGASDIIRGNDGEDNVDIAEMMTNDLKIEQQRKNAEFIVKAVNSYQALLDIVLEIADIPVLIENQIALPLANKIKAIAKSEGKI